jgi:quercetin 2,3-dioxygenase
VLVLRTRSPHIAGQSFDKLPEADMLTIRRAEDRGHADHGWLDTWHTFSFSSYYDPAHMGCSNLRVINDDRIAPGGGFPTHGHEDMEIVTYVLDGALQHKDSMGNGSVIAAGDVQYMAAGRGVRHSEYNASATEPVHLLQIWLVPNQQGVEPRYAQQAFSDAAKRNRLLLLVSPDGRQGSIATHQDALLYATRPDDGTAVTHRLAADREGYVHVARGSVRVNGAELDAGDGARLGAGEQFGIEGIAAGEVLLFDLP